MATMVGILNPGLNQEGIDAIICRQLNRVRVPGVTYQEYKRVYPGFGVGMLDTGILENGRQPAVNREGTVCLMLDGEISNADELKWQYRRSLASRDVSSAELCLWLIAHQGEGILKCLNGNYAIVVYDHSAGCVKLISDRFGRRPLYYLHRQNQLLFGSEIKAIAAVDQEARSIDRIGALELFAYGSHVMERTSIKTYWCIPPATIVAATRSTLDLRVYWNYRYEEEAKILGQETYFARFAILLDRAVERAMKGSQRIGLFLSGGYDSRSVAASIRKHHLPLPAFTFGYPQSRDVRFAKMLAERLGLEHHVLNENGPYLHRYCPSIVWRTEGMIPFSSTTSIRYHAALKAKTDIILTGFLGEFGGSHTWPRLLLSRSRRQAIKCLYDRLVGTRLNLVTRLFDPAFIKSNMDELRLRYERSFDQIENDHPWNIADCWRFVFQQPRGTWLSPRVDMPLLEVRAPHADYELVDFLLTIPPLARLEQRVYKKMIAYSFPAISDVPCTNSELPVNPKFFREYTAMVVRHLAAKAYSPIQNLRPNPPLGRLFRDLDYEFRQEPELASQILRPMLQDEIFPADIFNPGEIRKMIDEHYNGSGQHHGILSMLISWGLAQKYFVRGDLTDVPRNLYES